VTSRWFHIPRLYQSFSGVTTQLRSKDVLTHNVQDTVWMVEDCKSNKLYLNTHNSLVYNGTKIIF